MRPPILAFTRRILATFSVVLTLGGTAIAEPLTLSSVLALGETGPGGMVVDLFASPGAVLTGTELSFGTVSRAAVTFEALVAGSPGDAGDTLRATFQVPKGDQPFSNLVQEIGITSVPGGYVFGLDFPLLYHPVPMGLTLDFLQASPPLPGSPSQGQVVRSYTFTFSVVQPVPEPSSALLCSSGLPAVLLLGYWRHRRASFSRSR
jgi:hypothetical protein